MPTFEYTARTVQGQEQTGTIDLPTKEDVAAHLRKNKMVAKADERRLQVLVPYL